MGWVEAIPKQVLMLKLGIQFPLIQWDGYLNCCWLCGDFWVQLHILATCEHASSFRQPPIARLRLERATTTKHPIRFALSHLRSTIESRYLRLLSFRCSSFLAPPQLSSSHSWIRIPAEWKEIQSANRSSKESQVGNRLDSFIPLFDHVHYLLLWDSNNCWHRSSRLGLVPKTILNGYERPRFYRVFDFIGLVLEWSI